MLAKPLIFCNKIYELKYDIKSLWIINQLKSEIDDWMRFYLCFDKSIDINDIKNIYNTHQDISLLVNDVLYISTGDYNFEIDDNVFMFWYKIGVGEIGLAPEIFYHMTPVEFKLLIDGFIQNKKNNINLLLSSKFADLEINNKRISIDEKNILFNKFNEFGG